MSYITSAEYFGIQRGRQEGESLILISLLETKFGDVPESFVNKVKSANPDILVTWCNRVLSAESLQEVFEI